MQHTVLTRQFALRKFNYAWCCIITFVVVPSSRLLYGSKSVWNRKRKAAANRRRILLRESKKVSMASLKAGGTAEEEEEGDDDNLEVIGFCNCEEYNLAGLQMYLKAKVLLLESCCKQGCVVIVIRKLLQTRLCCYCY